MLLKQVHGRDDHSRCADAALSAAMFDECLLDCMQLSFAGRDTFDGFDLAILHLRDGHEATVHDLAVDSHRARAAFAFAASLLCSGQAELLAQDIQQTLHRKRLQRQRLAIHLTVDFDLFCQPLMRPFDIGARERRIS